MKFLFTAPRFHTNQVPIVKGLIETGHEVRYFVVYYGATEDHTYCNPLILKPSKTTLLEKSRVEQTMSENVVENYIGGNFIPDYRDLELKFKEYMPDAVVCRDKTYLTLSVYALCREYCIPCILYNQEPIYRFNSTGIMNNLTVVRKEGLFHRVAKKLKKIINPDLRRIYTIRDTVGFPQTRMTPVQYKMLPKELSSNEPDRNAYYVPFVVESVDEANNREYLHNSVLHILSVGKFRDYKNLPILIDAGILLKENCTFEWNMTIIGQVSNNDEWEYYASMVDKIHEAGLEDRITLKRNVPYNNMSYEYLENDLFVLPSKKEHASISVLEAMAHGLPAISTSYNGTASYIEEGYNGFVFESENAISLANMIRKAYEGDIKRMGKNAVITITHKYNWERYIDALQTILERIS